MNLRLQLGITFMAALAIFAGGCDVPPEANEGQIPEAVSTVETESSTDELRLPGGGVAPQIACGGTLLRRCPAGMYCATGPSGQCPGRFTSGVCARQPQACTKEYAPVAACNGKTYSNACTAAAEGVAVPAAAKPPGVRCGRNVCGEGLVCCNALCGICAPPGSSCVQGCAL